ncbi:cytochrome c oxidase subunit 3 [Rhodovastum atsumiense]|nr:cytochrome c oxidase subunit 3 [Rhodovastum atsumiense]
MLVFLGIIAAISFGWLARQRLASRPWLEEGIPDEGSGAVRLPAAKLGLGVFLAVAGSLFALLISAYVLRTEVAAPDGSGLLLLSAPRLLWFNTGVLATGSVALHLAQAAARRGHRAGLRDGLLAGGLAALTFVAGQVLVWRQLAEAGYFLTTSPASSFFYLITGLHGLHVLGGVAALARTTARLRHGVPTESLCLGVELCALYWHFLLLAWVVLFAVLMGWAGNVLDVCRAWLG